MQFVVCGEALIDMMPVQQVSPSESHWAALSGGSPVNAAVALARLGEDTSFLGRLGADAFGAQLAEYLIVNDVKADQLIRTDEATTLAVVSLADDGKASYVFHVDGTSNFGWQDHEFPELDADTWLHFGSIGAVLEPGHGPLLRFVQNTPATLSYDINVRPSLLPSREEYLDKVLAFLEAVGRGAGIAKASDEDINWLTDDTDPLTYAQEWASEFQLAAFVVTLGDKGAVALKPDGRTVEVAGHRVEVADTVGAGDTFMAGFLSHYCHRPDDMEGALRFGAAAAALVCQQRGANPPARAAVEEFLAR